MPVCLRTVTIDNLEAKQKDLSPGPTTGEYVKRAGSLRLCLHAVFLAGWLGSFSLLNCPPDS